jgi:exodeoxyribonuclease-5
MDASIQLNAGQQAALEKATDFLEREAATYLREFAPIFRIDGAAGTGKTELIKHILVRNPGGLPMAWTGRAVNMLRSKRITDALTIHSGLYKPEPVSQAYMAQLGARLKELNALHESSGISADEVAEREKLRHLIDKLNQPEFSLRDTAPAAMAEYLVLDEVSMISECMGLDLESLNIPIIVVGDDNQLPPIDGNPSYFDGDKDVVLTEIMRQRGTAGYAIIKLATDIRTGVEHRGRGKGYYGPNVACTGFPCVQCRGVRDVGNASGGGHLRTERHAP